jgi:hypothetical protein
MAKGGKAVGTGGTNLRGYWQEQIDKATKTYSDFHTGGDKVIDRYRIEKANASNDKFRDRYNILYSSTETIKPSLYAQTPKVEVKKRHRDRKSPVLSQAVNILETSITYALEETNIDEVMENVIEDYTLPGLGMAWVRYAPVFKDETDANGNAVTDKQGNPQQLLDYEGISLDYVHWKDVLFGPCRFWKELPWAARRVYMSKPKATKRIGKAKADRAAIVEDRQAIIWEVWDKAKREVIWFSEGYADDVLDRKQDPLGLKEFWPFPKPLRAISNTRTFVPRPFYAQYQSQAEELDELTARIRYLSEALNVRGVYDGSQDALAHLLASKGGNKLIAIDNWHQFIGEKGINGAVQWVPIDMIVQVLMELYKARDIVKNEIYEITGFSDITRGLSKASETLGAQQIKQEWASGRLRIMQKEVQRFVRDIVRIMGEIAAEHFSVETLALYSGFEVADPQSEEGVKQLQAFQQAVELIKLERERCANIGIETDSTVLPDEERERKDRLEFLGQMGAYLQQAGPMVMQYPQMGGLLMAMMMFSVRTFRASRPLEQEFEAFQDAFKANPPQPPQQGDDGAAKAQAAQGVAQIKVQGDKEKQQAELAFKAQEAEAGRQLERERMQLEREKLQADAEKAGIELRIKETELAIKQAELALKQQQAVQSEQDQAHRHALEEQDQEHRQAVDRDSAERQDYQFDREQENREQGGQPPLT